LSSGQSSDEEGTGAGQVELMDGTTSDLALGGHWIGPVQREGLQINIRDEEWRPSGRFCGPIFNFPTI